MLGLLNPGRGDVTYRSLYSRCCQFQHLEYGVPSLLFQSFEAVFLYAVACDAGAVDLAKVPKQVCCRLRAGRTLEFALDRELARFCASFSLLAAETKSADALRDAPGVFASLRHRAFRSRFRAARNYFASLDADFLSTFGGLINDHLAIENARFSPSLSAFCRPTASAFAYAFRLMAKVVDREDLEHLLENVGRNIGSAVLAFDCAQDWQQDRRTGHFNVVQDAVGAQNAFAHCVDRLADARGLCQSTFGAKALSAGILERVSARIRSRWSRGMSIQKVFKGTPATTSVVLNATCCFPCGDGAVAVDSDECGKLFCGCCCLAVCAVSACEGRCC
jgi:hypothetical protein